MQRKTVTYEEAKRIFSFHIRAHTKDKRITPFGGFGSITFYNRYSEELRPIDAKSPLVKPDLNVILRLYGINKHQGIFSNVPHVHVTRTVCEVLDGIQFGTGHSYSALFLLSAKIREIPEPAQKLSTNLIKLGKEEYLVF